MYHDTHYNSAADGATLTTKQNMNYIPVFKDRSAKFLSISYKFLPHAGQGAQTNSFSFSLFFFDLRNYQIHLEVGLSWTAFKIIAARS